MADVAPKHGNVVRRAYLGREVGMIVPTEILGREKASAAVGHSNVFDGDYGVVFIRSERARDRSFHFSAYIKQGHCGNFMPAD